MQKLSGFICSISVQCQNNGQFDPLQNRCICSSGFSGISCEIRTCRFLLDVFHDCTYIYSKYTVTRLASSVVRPYY